MIVGERIYINVATVRELNLKNGRAPGPETIPSEFVKCEAEKLFIGLPTVQTNI